MLKAIISFINFIVSWLALICSPFIVLVAISLNDVQVAIISLTTTIILTLYCYFFKTFSWALFCSESFSKPRLDRVTLENILNSKRSWAMEGKYLQASSARATIKIEFKKDTLKVNSERYRCSYIDYLTYCIPQFKKIKKSCLAKTNCINKTVLLKKLKEEQTIC